jgi:hypothetical protein
MNVGADNKCIIKIMDVDHPLADILGAYTVKGTDLNNSGQPAELGSTVYTMHLLKDPKDVTVVWCDGICQAASGLKLSVYGNVSEDHSTITFPCGQDTGYEVQPGRGNLIFCLTSLPGYQTDKTAEVVFTKTADGIYTSTNGMGLVDNISVYIGGFMLGAETDPMYSTTWTKQ